LILNGTVDLISHSGGRTGLPVIQLLSGKVWGLKMALFIKREFTWAEGARKSSVRFSIKIASVAGESAATTTRRFKQEAARIAQAFVREHESHNTPSPKGKNRPAGHSIGARIMPPT
jgi:hypothetical protein